MARSIIDDLERATTHEDRSSVLAPPDGFRVELNVPAADLVEVVRELRSRTGRARKAAHGPRDIKAGRGASRRAAG